MKDRKEYLKAYYQDHEEEAKAKNKAYYEANRNEIRAKQKLHRDANKEKINAQGKLYRDANKGKLLEYKKAYYKTNKGKILERKKAYREANKEKIRARKKLYYQKNKEKHDARVAAWRQKLGEEEYFKKTRAYKEKWRKNNLDKVNAKNVKYKAIQKEAVLPTTNLDAIKKFYGQSHKLSEETGKKYQVDHIIPISIGGAHHQDNLRVVIDKDNYKKSNKYIPELGGVWADSALARKTKKKLEIK